MPVEVWCVVYSFSRWPLAVGVLGMMPAGGEVIKSVGLSCLTPIHISPNVTVGWNNLICCISYYMFGISVE